MKTIITRRYYTFITIMEDISHSVLASWIINYDAFLIIYRLSWKFTKNSIPIKKLLCNFFQCESNHALRILMHSWMLQLNLICYNFFFTLVLNSFFLLTLATVLLSFIILILLVILIFFKFFVSAPLLSNFLFFFFLLS